ncbi:tyrS: tyrosine--tRNA ligase [Rubrobacter radiotolerans]|uniref:Tyrosine--tRNA ligase n=1 Tax=Rubrobacter radiotolerans TaxID=42256 RepID=A0A023X3K3_RUBRA|nr:tyrosine--tRNA ligase [Rubrobacter radiotolerans]AHY46570.1 tyrS: tyrosine--tRNA ligase [Rubrobacter radiotolerans]MDX5893977.1 tyrosine--tRNA ligase [Rubrobacter radiotolerans]SMC04892.1 tyrosyl-tRNA synthetase [Rubrobacter radiotolerans DSM 5868]
MSDLSHPVFQNAVDVVPREELLRRLQEGRPLRVKLGMDPTAPDIHLGHSVILRKLREFQDLGHTAVLIIGDYTALVGDPSGRSKTRPVLSPEEIERNTRTYLDQAYLVLDPERTEVRRNSEWLGALDMSDIIRLTRSTTVARILERDDFARRFAASEPISLTELLYPMMQAYDSVVVEADVELGGTDQLYNLLMGRHVMEFYGKTPQCVLTMPLLVGTDGQKKMSKSLGNYIGMTDAPADVFGKAMSIPDELMPNYYALLLGGEPLPDVEPVEQKRHLARRLVADLHGQETVQDAERHFDTVTRRGVPEDVPEVEIAGEEVWVVDLITRAGFATTNGEARRFLKGGAVRLDGEPVSDEKLTLRTADLAGKVLQVGKRRYARITTT